MKFKTQMTHAEVRAKSWHGNDINKTLTEIILFPFQRLTFTNTWSAQAGIFKVQLKMFWDPEERYAVEMYFKWTSFSALKIILRKLLNWHSAIHQTMQNIFPIFNSGRPLISCFSSTTKWLRNGVIFSSDNLRTLSHTLRLLTVQWKFNTLCAVRTAHACPKKQQ